MKNYNKEEHCMKRVIKSSKITAALGRDYSHIPEVDRMNYVNRKSNGLPGLNTKQFVQALEDTGLDAFKILSTHLRGVSTADLKDEFNVYGKFVHYNPILIYCRFHYLNAK